MALTNSSRFANRGRTALLLAAGMLFLGWGIPAHAQPDDDTGLEGTWRVQVTVRDCNTGTVLRNFAALFAFAKGGTVTNTTGGQFPALFTPGFGVWQHTQGHSYTAVREAFVFSTGGVWIQTHRFTHSIELGGDSNEYTDTINLQIFDTSGNLLGTGCGTSVATRF